MPRRPAPTAPTFQRTRSEDRDRAARYAVIASQRGRIIEGAVEATFEKGYAATTLADIVARARVSRSTFYEHFPSKEDCLVEAVRLATEVLRTELVATAADRAEAGWDDLVDALMTTYCRVIAAEPDFATAVFCVSLEAGGATRAAHDDGVDTVVGLLADLAVDRGRQRPEGEPLAIVLDGVAEHTRRIIAKGEIDRLPDAAAAFSGLIRQVT